MKGKKITISIFVTAAIMSILPILSISAATKEDVIAAAKAAGFSENVVQSGINLIESGNYSEQEYDSMLSAIEVFKGMTNEAIKECLNSSGINVDIPSSENNEESSKEFSSLTEKEKDEYIADMTTSEKNQIIKELDRDKQIEIIDKLIDASESIGLNVTVDSLSKDKLEYSIRDTSGEVVDIASVGNIVDDTGIDYTLPVVGSAVILLVSVGGVIFLDIKNKQSSGERK